MKSKAPEFCPKHPKEKLVEVQAPEGLGDALTCPTRDCNYLVILENKKKTNASKFLNDQDVSVFLIHSHKNQMAKLEFRLYLDSSRLPQLILPDCCIEAYKLMDKPGGLLKAELDFEISEQTIELRSHEKQASPDLKLVHVEFSGFKLEKIEHRGTGTAQDKIELIFQIKAEYERKLAVWLSTTAGKEMILKIYPSQPRLPDDQ